MKMTGFSFKNEAIWMLVFSIASGVLGLLMMLFVFLFRRWL